MIRGAVRVTGAGHGDHQLSFAGAGVRSHHGQQGRVREARRHEPGDAGLGGQLDAVGGGEGLGHAVDHRQTPPLPREAGDVDEGRHDQQQREPSIEPEQLRPDAAKEGVGDGELGAEHGGDHNDRGGAQTQAGAPDATQQRTLTWMRRRGRCFENRPTSATPAADGLWAQTPQLSAIWRLRSGSDADSTRASWPRPSPSAPAIEAGSTGSASWRRSRSSPARTPPRSLR